ncbi:STM3941 family protein [Marisediminicola sp. LYQ134]|uniref:STM3941 family protein n=1 Tax=unclassified Marisediminicola TaxID=2618316 RepID=UPI003983202D
MSFARDDRDSAELPTVTLGGSWLKTALMLVVCGVFVLIGFAILRADPGIVEIVAAAAAIVFFGLGGLALGVQSVRRRTVLTLTPDGLRPVSGGFVPWSDVDDVGLGSTAGTTVIGIRLSSPDAYIDSLSEAEVTRALRFSSGARLFGVASRSFARGRGSGALGSLPDASEGMAAQLAWAREQSGGFDLTFSPMLFAGPPTRVVETVTAHRDAWRSRYGDPRRPSTA